MAAPSSCANLSPLHALLLHLLLPSLTPPISSVAAGPYSAIFSFGDSLTDTGNLVLFSDGDALANRVPYGETYFLRPSGRFSDGRIILDFIAQAMGLPLVPPYGGGHGAGGDFGHGANFAVAGACALSNTFYEKEGFIMTEADYSLVTQLEWFRQLVESSSTSPSLAGTRDIWNHSFFFMGEIGVNDYNYLLQEGKSIDFVRTFVPPVTKAIASAIDELIEMGAKTVMVGGMFPMGCIPLFLTRFQTQSVSAYEAETGCLKSLDELSQYHNLLLLDELRAVQRAHPSCKIIYTDYYRALMSIYTSPEQFGMKWPLQACCGGGGPYNFSDAVFCGDEKAGCCDDPGSYVCWDGAHLTEAASQVIAGGILDGSYVEHPSEETCLDRFDQIN